MVSVSLWEAWQMNRERRSMARIEEGDQEGHGQHRRVKLAARGVLRGPDQQHCQTANERFERIESHESSVALRVGPVLENPGQPHAQYERKHGNRRPQSNQTPGLAQELVLDPRLMRCANFSRARGCLERRS